MKLATKLLAFTFLAFMPFAASKAQIIDFDDLDGYTTNGLTGSYFDGYGASATPAFNQPGSGSWTTQGVSFNTKQFGPGWSYSNVDDTTTAGFTNQWAAIPGSDVSGTGNYVIGTSFLPGGAFFNFVVPTQVNSVAVTNTTYAALSMQNGDGPGGFAKKFGGPTDNDPDFFRVTFTGHSEADKGGVITGTQEFYLADYRFADNSLDYIVVTWNLLDLSSLGTVQSVSFGLESSDVGAGGMNTPAYVAIDNLSITAVPEPSSAILLGLGALTLVGRRRKLK